MQLYRSDILTIFLLGLNILSQHLVLSLDEPCTKAANKSRGVCVNMRQCPVYMDILRKYGTEAGNLLRSTLCYYENAEPIVCCPRSRVKPHPETTTRPSQPTSVPVLNTTYTPLYAPQCGTNTDQRNRIVGGEPAKLGAWPWMTALGYRNKKTKHPDWLCGGSLISARHVLTAAHCVYNRYDLYLARLGEHDLSSNSDGANPIDVPIMRGTLHPEYSNVTHVNDIAVLRLKYEVTFSDTIHPICLPLIPEIKNKDFVRHLPFVAGWGAVFFHGPKSTVLLEAQVPVASHEHCQRAYAKYNRVIDDRVLCVGQPAGGKDACQGDSGGPLMFPKDTAYYIIGIVSLGYRCAEPGVPGIYTRVAYYQDFILANLN